MISVELSKRFKKIVRDARRESEVSATIRLVIEGYGKPHLHSGLSIRKLDRLWTVGNFRAVEARRARRLVSRPQFLTQAARP